MRRMETALNPAAAGNGAATVLFRMLGIVRAVPDCEHLGLKLWTHAWIQMENPEWTIVRV